MLREITGVFGVLSVLPVSGNRIRFTGKDWVIRDKGVKYFIAGEAVIDGETMVLEDLQYSGKPSEKAQEKMEESVGKLVEYFIQHNQADLANADREYHIAKVAEWEAEVAAHKAALVQLEAAIAKANEFLAVKAAA